MNNNWRGRGGVYFFRAGGGEEDWFCSASRLGELITEQGGGGGGGGGGVGVGRTTGATAGHYTPYGALFPL